MFTYRLVWTEYWKERTAASIWCRQPTVAGELPPFRGEWAWVPSPLLEETWGTVPLVDTIFYLKKWVEIKVKGWLFFTQTPHVSWKPVVCTVLNQQPLLQRHIHFFSTRWTPLLLLVSTPPFPLLLICYCFRDLLVWLFLLLRFSQVLLLPLPHRMCFILMNFFLFYAIFFWYFLWGKIPKPWSGASQLKKVLKLAVGTLNEPDVHKEW